MRTLTKTEYKKVINKKILITGLYCGRSVEEAEEDDELYEHLKEIKNDYVKGNLGIFNADAEMAYNFLKYEDIEELANIDDLYGSYDENMKDINDHFGKY